MATGRVKGWAVLLWANVRTIAVSSLLLVYGEDKIAGLDEQPKMRSKSERGRSRRCQASEMARG
jgi:hypothetical protein